MFVSNAVYALPSFKSRGSLVSSILGNWQLNGIVTVLSGIPLDINSGIGGLYFGLAASARVSRRVSALGSWDRSSSRGEGAL